MAIYGQLPIVVNPRVDAPAKVKLTPIPKVVVLLLWSAKRIQSLGDRWTGEPLENIMNLIDFIMTDATRRAPQIAPVSVQLNRLSDQLDGAA